LVAVVVLLLSACGTAPSSTASGPIKVGFLYPFQGDNAIFGQWAKAGIDLRLRQAGMKFQGRDIQVFTANEDPTNPAATLQGLKTLVQQNGVSVVIGPAFSSSEEAVAAYAKQANITLLILLTCPWDIAPNNHLLCWPGTDVATTRALGDYAYDVAGYRHIDTIGPDYVAGRNYIGGAADEFVRKGGTLTQQQWVPLTTTDIGPYLAQVNKNADALVIWLLPSNEVAFLQQYRSQGLKLPLLLEFGLQDPYLQQLGAQLVGSIGADFWEPTVQSSISQKFVSDFTKAYPDAGQPNITQEGGWTMTDALLRGLESTGGDSSYGKLYPTLKKMHWDTPEGPACFSANNMALTTQYITQLELANGKYSWKVIKEYPYQSDPHDTGKCG
jgi:branched-chain amino acid transport system substrate-binding protein